MLAIERPPRALVGFLARESEGNPFFVSEYLHAVVDADLLRRGDGGEWQVVQCGEPEDGYRALPLPHTVRDLVGRRLAHLGPEAQAMAETAAVLGRDFEVALAAALADLDEPRRVEAVRELLAGQVVEDAEAGRLRFAHDKLREVAYERIPVERRTPLHRRTAALLEAHHGGDPDFAQRYGLLAHHWSLAGIESKALEYLGRAGEHALSTGAHRDARDLLTRALALEGRPGLSVEPVQRARWLRMLGEAAFGVGDLAACVRHTAGALEVLGVPNPATARGWAVGFGTALVRQVTYRAVPVARLRSPRQQERWLEAARAAGQLATTHYYAGDMLPSVVTLLRGANFAERAGAASPLAESFARLGYVAGAARLARAARAYFRRAYRLARQAEDPAALALTCYLDANYLLGLGEWSRCEAAGAEALAILERIGDRQDAEVTQTIIGHALHYQGGFEAARRHFTVLLESARRRGNPQHIAWGLVFVGRALAGLGRPEEAVAFLEEGHATLPAEENMLSVAMCEGALASALLALGRLGDAGRVATALSGRLRKSARFGPLIDGYGPAADVLLTLWERGDVADGVARRATRDLRRFARMFPIAAPAALRTSAREQWLLGRRTRAVRTWERSIRAAHERAMPYDEALAHRDLAAYATSADARRAHHEQACRLLASLGNVRRSTAPGDEAGTVAP